MEQYGHASHSLQTCYKTSGNYFIGFYLFYGGQKKFTNWESIRLKHGNCIKNIAWPMFFSIRFLIFAWPMLTFSHLDKNTVSTLVEETELCIGCFMWCGYFSFKFWWQSSWIFWLLFVKEFFIDVCNSQLFRKQLIPWMYKCDRACQALWMLLKR